MVALAKHNIDGLLGEGWYDEWQQLEKDTALEKRRAETNQKRFSGVKAPGTSDQLWWDLHLLEGVASDYRAAMNLIAAGQTVDAARVGQIHDVLTLALGTVKHDNDALDAAFAAGLVAAFVAIPFAVFQKRAERLSKLLSALKRALEQAKYERNTAWVQGGLNAVVTVVGLFIPPVGLLARLGIAAGFSGVQWFYDDFFGPSTPTAATVGSKTSITVSQFGDAVADMERLGSTTRSVAKGAGEAMTITGFAFDVNEIMIGHRNADRVQQALSQAEKAYADLLSELRRHRAPLARFVRDYQRWQVSIKSIRENAKEIRYALLEEMRRSGYSPA